VVGDDGRPRQLPWEDWSDIEAVAGQTSAWMRATSPSGAVAYEGRPAWSGELGYGVRPPEQGQTAPGESTEAGDDESAAIFEHPHVPKGHVEGDDVAHGAKP
jgi:hypothetical protein